VVTPHWAADDYDQALAQWVLAQAGVSLSQVQDLAAVRMAAKRCKEALTDSDEAVFSMDLHSGQRLEQRVTRADFDQATAALTKRSISAVRRALRDADLQPEEVQGVVMVGGSTRMPRCRRR
jgi:Molecular chaperone